MIHDVDGGHDDNPLTEVRAGMSVVDAEGARLGVIAAVKMGDPGAITHRGQGTAAENGLVALVRDTFAGAEPHVAAESAGRLLRVGYISRSTADACSNGTSTQPRRRSPASRTTA